MFLKIFLSLACLVAAGNVQGQDLTQWVNPFVGTADHGHTFPGAVTPFGMIQASPDTRSQGWDACSGYHYSDTWINGFSQTHLSGTGCADMGDFLIMPTTGEQDMDIAHRRNYVNNNEAQNRSYASPFSHADEEAHPGYYRVMLTRYGINAEIAAADRSALYRFTYPKSQKPGLIVDIDYSIPNGQYMSEMNAEQTSPTMLSATKTSSGWANRDTRHLALESSRPFAMTLLRDTIGDNPRCRALLTFEGSTQAGDTIMVKLAISAVDVAGAKNNLKTEIADFNFNRVRSEATAKWNRYLGRMLATDSDPHQLRTFYTALYHSAIAPNLFTDADGRYRGIDHKIYKGENIYTVFSTWDTHRALHPLFSIIAPEMNNRFAHSLIDKARQGGILPMWELAGSYTTTMPGYHSVAILADIAAKRQADFDVVEALRWAKRSSRFDTTGINAGKAWIRGLSPRSKLFKDSLGFIPWNEEHEAVAKGLEYAYDDYCVSVLAHAAGDTAAEAEFKAKGQYYRHYFDPATRFMRGKDVQGRWHEPFNPFSSTHEVDDYCEGTAFQWNWFVPHDPEGLISLMGGKRAFLQRLDSLFIAPDQLEGNPPPDISGLIGQYAHGNEPSHHILHLYNYAGMPSKTQEMVGRVMSELYGDGPDGLCGNEDCGQMSAWYLMNAMGIYQVAAGRPVYSIGRPWFAAMTVNLGNGKQLKIETEHFSRNSHRIASVWWNGKKLSEPFITHDELMKGGTLKFMFTPSPASEVNPFVGTTNLGTTNPGALRPNGLMSVTPFNVMGSDLNLHDKDAGWWSAPYDHSNSFFTGLAHVNLSGVGCPELSTLLLMPTTGALNVDYHDYGCTYAAEDATPGLYTVLLDNGTHVETTATRRVGLTRFTFAEGKEAHVLLNLGEGLTNETGATARLVGPGMVEGSRLVGTFCYERGAVFPLYFALKICQKPDKQGLWKKQRPMTGTEADWDPDDGHYKLYPNFVGQMGGDDIGAWFSFPASPNKQAVEVRLAVSLVSTANAWENLEAEAPATLTFDQAVADGSEEWNELLGRVEVKGGTKEQRQVFYTALYHTLIHPNIMQDTNGQYPAMESRETLTAEGDRYTVFSLWDTYRNLHPLLTLLYPDRQEAMLRSLTAISKEWGWMPRWELYGRETYTMEGDPALPVIVDSYRKGLTHFDLDAAYNAMRRSATTAGSDNPLRPDNNPYMKRGYVPVDPNNVKYPGDNSVSHALEYYVADHALAWLARERGDKGLADSLDQRVKGWRKYYSPESGTLRPVMPDGSFYSPFDPRQGENFAQVVGFHEGSAWNYTFFVPHDIKGLTALMGGTRRTAEKLKSVFNLGLYDPANEPDIAYPYLFTHLKGYEPLAQTTAQQLLNKHFRNAPDGLPGNDDTGTMSAWAVWTMIGLYPDRPAEPEYAWIDPVFSKVTLHLDPRYYKKSTVTLTPQKHRKQWRISHEELITGRAGL